MPVLVSVFWVLKVCASTLDLPHDLDQNPMTWNRSSNNSTPDLFIAMKTIFKSEEIRSKTLIEEIKSRVSVLLRSTSYCMLRRGVVNDSTWKCFHRVTIHGPQGGEKSETWKHGRTFLMLSLCLPSWRKIFRKTQFFLGKDEEIEQLFLPELSRSISNLATVYFFCSFLLFWGTVLKLIWWVRKLWLNLVTKADVKSWSFAWGNLTRITLECSGFMVPWVGDSFCSLHCHQKKTHVWCLRKKNRLKKTCTIPSKLEAHFSWLQLPNPKYVHNSK